MPSLELAGCLVTDDCQHSGRLTLLPQGHLDLQHLEVIGVVGLDLAAHALATPLLEAVELLVDVHG